MPSMTTSRAIHWDGTVTAGNVLTALAMLMAVAGVWFRLEGRVDFHADRLQRLELARERDDRETMAQREALAVLRANQEAMLNSQIRMERALESMAVRLNQREAR